MSEPCRIRQGLFGRWYIFHPDEGDAQAWSGARWVPADTDGIPIGKFQVCNFESEEEAREYCNRYDLKPL